MPATAPSVPRTSTAVIFFSSIIPFTNKSQKRLYNNLLVLLFLYIDNEEEDSRQSMRNVTNGTQRLHTQNTNRTQRVDKELTQNETERNTKRLYNNLLVSFYFSYIENEEEDSCIIDAQKQSQRVDKELTKMTQNETERNTHYVI